MQDILKRVKEVDAVSGDVDAAVWSRRMLARPYARGLFDAARRTRHLDRVETDLQKAVDVCLAGDMPLYLEDPEVRFEDKSRLLAEETGNAHAAVMDLVYGLMERKQLHLLPDILGAYRRLCSGRSAIMRAEIITAIPLDEEDLQRIGRRLGGLVGKKVMLEPRVDPAIIGGFIIRLGSTKMDASIRSGLISMRKNMTGANIRPLK